MKAKVTLRDSLTYQIRGRIFKRGVPQMVTDPQEIEDFMTTKGFTVTVLEDSTVQGGISSKSNRQRTKSLSLDED